MGEWDVYQNRMGVRGNTRRSSHLNRELQSIARHLPDNLSYTEAVIYQPEHCFNVPADDVSEFAIRQNVAVINSDNLNEKMIMAMPGEEIENGSLVHWMDQYWLISEQDANNTVYRRNKMLQCNYLLKWIDDEHQIYEQWVAVEDGTKYLTGEYEDRSFVTTRGDSRIAITIARNIHTAKLGRLNRFLIDDELSGHKLAYALTKPLKFAGVYGGKGVYKFVLQEVNTTDDDNEELGIADYWKHFLHKPDKEGNVVLRPDTDTYPADPRYPQEEKTERGKWM